MLIIPSVYMGNLFYWNRLSKGEPITMDEGEFFVKQTYRNRTEIATESGITALTVPLEKGKNSRQPMREVRLSYAENWPALHFKTIGSAYGRAAYFEHYKPELEHLFALRPTYLCELNTIWRNFFAREFEIDVSLTVSGEYIPPVPSQTDLRTLMHPKADVGFSHAKYYHVFFDRYPQPQNLSVLDLLMNEGPRGRAIFEF